LTSQFRIVGTILREYILPGSQDLFGGETKLKPRLILPYEKDDQRGFVLYISSDFKAAVLALAAANPTGRISGAGTGLMTDYFSSISGCG
jgi:hypothetical protein